MLWWHSPEKLLYMIHALCAILVLLTLKFTQNADKFFYRDPLAGIVANGIKYDRIV